MIAGADTIWAMRDGPTMEWRGPIEPERVQEIRELGFEVCQVPAHQVLTVKRPTHAPWRDPDERARALDLLNRVVQTLDPIAKQSRQLRHEVLPLIVDAERFIRDCERSHTP